MKLLIFENSHLEVTMANGLTLPKINQPELPSFLVSHSTDLHRAEKFRVEITRYGFTQSSARFGALEPHPLATTPVKQPDPAIRVPDAALPKSIIGLLVSQMALRSATGRRGPGRRQIAAWLGLDVETVLQVAAQSGVAPPPDRRFVQYKNPRFLSVEARSVLIGDYVSDREINEIAQGIGKTRQQVLRIYGAMGLGVGRGEKTRLAFRAEIADLRARQPEAIIEPPKPTPLPTPKPKPLPSPESSPRPNRKCRKPVFGRSKKISSVSPAYTTRKVEILIREFVAKAGEFLTPAMKSRLADRCRIAYAASQGELVISKPKRGMSDEFLEVLSVYYIAGVSPGAVCRIFGLSKPLVLRIFSNFLSRPEVGFGRGNRAAWPGGLVDNFDLAKISEGYGVLTLVFRPCIVSQTIFVVRRRDRTKIHVSPFYAARMRA